MNSLFATITSTEKQAEIKARQETGKMDGIAETEEEIKERQSRGLFKSSELSEEQIKKNFFSSEQKYHTPMGYLEKKKLGLI